ncbi:hypothetical protein [Lysobacter niastensis]|uniref:GH18 domain-containing protein n=1 Tax=Lysobacter niastensis TaxID=380629 RepID=A0ABS0B6Z7_9GAMM|nr:hypothetical protein [Lysobacter niastensis]MBF6024587.1 hypothetical protein [Lysobacter niastensis]
MRWSMLAGMLLALLALFRTGSAGAAQIQVYGVWHCSNDGCNWGKARSIAEFDSMNRWLVDRGDGRPSVNLVVLSFVHPLKLLDRTTDATTLNGIPRGMTPEIVRYFTDRGIRVMVSIGGVTYTRAWDTALARDPTLLGLAAAQMAMQLGVGVEIDYEQDRSPDLAGLQDFISAYRSALPYDASGRRPAARLTIDLAAGNRWLVDLSRKAAADWLRTDRPVLDYANAIVPDVQPGQGSATSHWQEHIDGVRHGLAVEPLAPAKLTAALYLAGDRRPRPECNHFAASLQSSTGAFVQSAAPNGAGTTPGLLGYMFWAAERPTTHGRSTQPPGGCEGGVGTGATVHAIPIPMPPLRQE